MDATVDAALSALLLTQDRRKDIITSRGRKLQNNCYRVSKDNICRLVYNPTMDITDSVVGISFGIKYARKFRILDITGDIIDDILYSKSSPFGPSMFTSVNEKSDREKILFGEKEYLRVNTDDIILGFKVKDGFTNSMNWLEKDVIKYYNQLFTKYNINNILRIGIVFHIKFDNDPKLIKSIKEFAGDLASSPKGVTLRFSEKEATTEALLRKRVKDYKNIIYTFSSDDKDLSLDLDYQYFFDPAPEDIRQFDTSKILVVAVDYLKTNVSKWIATHYEES